MNFRYIVSMVAYYCRN